MPKEAEGPKYKWLRIKEETWTRIQRQRIETQESALDFVDRIVPDDKPEPARSARTAAPRKKK